MFRRLSGRVVLASSMKLEYPLNDSLPNIQHARDRLLARIFHFRQESEHSSLATDGDYALLYAYGMFFFYIRLSGFRSDADISAQFWLQASWGVRLLSSSMKSASCLEY